MTAASVDRQSRSAVHVPYRLSLEAAGFLTFVLGAWVGIVAYVAPAFGLSGDGTDAWTWSLAHSLLFLAPGAGALVAGLIIIVEAPSAGPRRGLLLSFAAVLATLCGAWLLVGPVAWRSLEGVNFFVRAPTATREFAHWVAYAVGPGGLLLAFGAFVLGRPHAAQVVDTATRPREEPPPKGAAPAFRPSVEEWMPSRMTSREVSGPGEALSGRSGSRDPRGL